MLFAETSDTVQIATMLIGLVGTVFASIMTYYMAKLKQGQTETAKVLETTVTTTDKKLDDIHVAVNGNNQKLEAKIDSLNKQLQESLQREAKQKG